MSFLFKKKKVFLFVFLFVFLIQGVFSLVQAEGSMAGIGGIIPYDTSGFTEEDWKAVDTSPTRSKVWSLGDFFMAIGEGILGVAMTLATIFFIPAAFILNSLSAILLGITSYGFNLSLETAVYGMSKIVNAPGSVIKEVWLIFRNLANVGLIFVIIFIAIQTILKSGYESKKLLGGVIIAGLLMNFSFMIGAVVVDVSNQMAIGLYDQVGEIVGKNQSGSLKLGDFYYEKTMTGSFGAIFLADFDENTKKIYEETTGKKAAQNMMQDQNMVSKIQTFSISLTMGAIMQIVLAIVLGIAMTMVIGRLVAILLLLVVSPIAFVSLVLPSTQKISKDWWGSIVGQSFFLPVFMLFILIGVKITEKLPEYLAIGKQTSEISVADAVFDLNAKITEAAPIIFNSAVIIGLFIAGLIAAKKVADQGSAVVGKISATVSSATGGAAMATGAFAARNTIGAGASALQKNEKVQEWLRNRSPLIGGTLGKSLEGVAKSSFDARNSKAFKGVASATGVSSNYASFGSYIKPAKDGFKGQTERVSKSLQNTYSSIPDRKDDHVEVQPKKQQLDLQEQALENAQQREKSIKDALVQQGIDINTDATYQSAKQGLESDKTARETAHKEYLDAKNPTKQKFINKPNKLEVVVKPWLGGAYEDARKKLPLVKSEAEKQNEAILKALEKLNNQNKT
jgi:hypothetical protein